VYEIIRVAHNRNSHCGLTGALIMLDGHFLQVLEGGGFHVDQRMTAIKNDARHHALELRERRPIAAPSFPGQWMALRQADGVPAAVKARFGYEPGFPAERFSPAQLLAFALACCASTDH
jgi:hypothetical protein